MEKKIPFGTIGVVLMIVLFAWMLHEFIQVVGDGR